MDTRLVTLKDISAQDERAWRELAARSLEPNPFFEPDFLVLNAKHFDGYAQSTLVVASEGSTFRGVLPIVAFEKPRIPPRMVTSTVGIPTAVRLLGTPLIDKGTPDEAMGALLDALRDAWMHKKWPGIVSLEKAGVDGPVMSCLQRMSHARSYPVFTKETWERGVVHRGGAWEHPVGKNRGLKIGQKRRALARDLGMEVTLVDRTLDPSVVEDFLVMEMSGWKAGETGLAFGKDPAKVAWFHEWYERWSPSGRLVVLSLQVGDIPIAIEVFVRARDAIFCFRGAYDAAYARYGPGAMVLADCMSYLLEHTDATWMDSTTDKDNALFLELFPERRTLSMLYIGVGGRLDRSVVAALPAMTRLVAEQRRIRNGWTRARTTRSRPAGD
jgi:Acetyltransferase (GNAT) domain